MAQGPGHGELPESKTPRLRLRCREMLSHALAEHGYWQGLIFLCDLAPRSAAMNMALDEALLRLSGSAVLRVYGWERRSVSFGYFGRYAAVAAAWPGRELVRRMTGGGVVPHGEDITYTVVAPAGHELAQLSAMESYSAIHTAIARWLAARGVRAALAPQDAPGGNGNCFESPVAADVMAGSLKLAGAAQRRTREGLLVQGSIQSVPREWAGEIGQAFECAETRNFTAAELELAQRLAMEKYGSPAWTHRL